MLVYLSTCSEWFGRKQKLSYWSHNNNMQKQQNTRGASSSYYENNCMEFKKGWHQDCWEVCKNVMREVYPKKNLIFGYVGDADGGKLLVESYEPYTIFFESTRTAGKLGCRQTIPMRKHDGKLLGNIGLAPLIAFSCTEELRPTNYHIPVKGGNDNVYTYLDSRPIPGIEISSQSYDASNDVMKTALNHVAHMNFGLQGSDSIIQEYHLCLGLVRYIHGIHRYQIHKVIFLDWRPILHKSKQGLPLSETLISHLPSCTKDRNTAIKELFVLLCRIPCLSDAMPLLFKRDMKAFCNMLDEKDACNEVTTACFKDIVRRVLLDEKLPLGTWDTIDVLND